MTGGPLTLLRGNALTLPLADGTVSLVVSSPPYFAVRDYQDNGASLDGQLGSEATPFHFLASLWQAMDECWRVLRDDGSCWINLGDKMSGSGGHNNAGISKHGFGSSTLQGNGKPDIARRQALKERIKATRRSAPDRYNQSTGGLRVKSRMLLPHRFAEGCQDPDYRQWVEQRAGLPVTACPPQWILRMDVVWSKRNHLPESVSDRVVAAHEYWFHLVKSERYYAATDEIREPLAPKTLTHRGGGKGWGNDTNPDNNWGDADTRQPDMRGALPGSVWEVASEPLRVPEHLGLEDHYAAFPSELPRRIVLGWSPPGVCTACGEGRRRPVVDIDRTVLRRLDGEASKSAVPGKKAQGGYRGEVSHSITGYACACPTPDAPTTPATVLDPFAGTGTTPIVAAALGRHGVGVELSADYLRLARWRAEDPTLRCKVLGVEKPAPELDGQLGLFGGEAA